MNAQLILMTKRVLLSCVMLSTAHAGWEALPPLPEPNGGFMCGAAQGKIVVVGGTNWEGGKKNWLKAVHQFDPAGKTWTKVKDLASPVAYGTALQQGDAFVYLGGSDGRQAMKTLSTLAGSKTSVLLPELPNAVVLAAGGLVGGKHLLVGGTADAADIAGVQRSTHVVEFVSGTWQVGRLADYPGKAFAVAASAVAGDELLVFGGMNYDAAAKAPLNSAEAYAFSPAQNVWRKLTPLSTPNRGLTAVALDERHIYVAGGYTDDFTTEAVIYDVKSDSYRKARSLPYAAMVGLVKHDGFIYCLGGEDKKQSRTDKFFRISVAELLK